MKMFQESLKFPSEGGTLETDILPISEFNRIRFAANAWLVEHQKKVCSSLGATLCQKYILSFYTRITSSTEPFTL